MLVQTHRHTPGSNTDEKYSISSVSPEPIISFNKVVVKTILHPDAIRTLTLMPFSARPSPQVVRTIAPQTRKMLNGSGFARVGRVSSRVVL